MDARRDVLRAVHDHARQHGRERRAAVDPAATSAPASRASSGPSTPTRSASRVLLVDRRAARRHLRPPADVPDRRRRSSPLSSATAGLAPGHRRCWSSAASSRASAAALMMPATLSIVTNAFEPHERGKAIGTWAGVSALALAIGPVARRPAHRARLLARDLLPQHPGRGRRRRRDPLRGPRVARRDGRPRGRLPRRRHADRRPHGAGPRPDRGQRVGLGLGRRSSACSARSVVVLGRLRRRSSAGSRRRWSSSACSLAATSSAPTWSR